MRNLVRACIEGRYALYFIAACIAAIMALSSLRCKTPQTIASATWKRNAEAIEALKTELPNATPERAAKIKGAIDALEKSNETIETETARADEAEKSASAASGRFWELVAGVVVAAAGLGAWLWLRR